MKDYYILILNILLVDHYNKGKHQIWTTLVEGNIVLWYWPQKQVNNIQQSLECALSMADIYTGFIISPHQRNQPSTKDVLASTTINHHGNKSVKKLTHAFKLSCLGDFGEGLLIELRLWTSILKRKIWTTIHSIIEMKRDFQFFCNLSKLCFTNNPQSRSNSDWL